MAQSDRHLTSEQLSTLLDNRQEDISKADREHLSGCSQCRQDLAERRQTVRLLHALPQPTLPRSFVLPASMAQVTPARAEVPAQSNIHIVRSTDSLQRQRHPYKRASAGRRVLSLAGALAAVIGILFILSGFVPSLPLLAVNGGSVSSGASSTSTSPQETNSSASSANQPATSAGGAAQQVGTPAVAAQPRGVQANQLPATPQAQNAASVQSAPPQQNSGGSEAAAPAFPFLDWEGTGIRIGLGILLFIAGAMSFALGRERKREANV